MRVTTHTDYSLRVLTYVAVQDNASSTIAAIAQAYGISRNHLMKVVHQLQLSGFVRTARGKAGGLWLARPADQISVGDVVRAMEPDLRLVECFGPANRCTITPSCHLKSLFGDARDAFMMVLDTATIADLVRGRERPLRRRLGLPPPSAGRRRALMTPSA